MITIDFDQAVISNIAILEVDFFVDGLGEPATVAKAESFLKAANATAPACRAAAVATVQKITKLASTDPEFVDSYLGRFFGGGRREHIEGRHAPFVRLGHPPAPHRLRVDLENTSGVVVGVIRNAWMDGPQLRGDIVFLDSPPPPIPDWTDVLAAILSMAADLPESLGMSCVWLDFGGSGTLAAAVDLVGGPPALNRNGLLGLPTNGLATHPQPAVREIGRRRSYWPQVVHEALIESWITGEPV